MKKTLIAALLMAAGVAQAAAPTATFTGKLFSFVDYLTTDIVKTVEDGQVDTDYTLFWFAEQQSVSVSGFSGLVSSYYVFFDPEANQRVNATVTFDAPILAVFSTQGSLLSSVGDFGIGGINYAGSDYDDLERFDTVSYSGSTLSLNWQATDPGDHVRVILAAVPEPEAPAMLLAGLGMLGLVARRRLGR